MRRRSRRWPLERHFPIRWWVCNSETLENAFLRRYLCAAELHEISPWRDSHLCVLFELVLKIPLFDAHNLLWSLRFELRFEGGDLLFVLDLYLLRVTIGNWMICELFFDGSTNEMEPSVAYSWSALRDLIRFWLSINCWLNPLLISLCLLRSLRRDRDVNDRMLNPITTNKKKKTRPNPTFLIVKMGWLYEALVRLHINLQLNFKLKNRLIAYLFIIWKVNLYCICIYTQNFVHCSGISLNSTE